MQATDNLELGAFVGIDWADREHAVCVLDVATGQKQKRTLVHKPEELAEWALSLKARYGDRPVGVAIEQSRGALVYSLMQYPWMVLYPINPRSLAKYREALYPSRAKDDPTDAELLCDFLRHHQRQLKAWKPEDDQTRKLRLLLEQRECLVDERTRHINRLISSVKIHFPQALQWAGEIRKPMAWAFLLKWPTLKELQSARRDTVLEFFYAHHVRRGDKLTTIYDDMQKAVPLVTDPVLVDTGVMLVQALCRQLQVLQGTIDRYDKEIAALFKQHPEKDLFAHLPGAGPVLKPRLLVAFGTDRDRYADAQSLQELGGIAPVIERSGNAFWVHWRWAASQFLRQSFHEYASHSLVKSAWARACYDQLRARGKGHHAAIRVVAFKWIRILFRCWQDRVPYDEARYIEALKKRGSPLALLITQQSAALAEAK